MGEENLPKHWDISQEGQGQLRLVTLPVHWAWNEGPALSKKLLAQVKHILTYFASAGQSALLISFMKAVVVLPC